MYNKLSWIPKSFLLILTFLLPLKFGSTIGVPEMPMTYWREPLSIIVASWPVLLFPLFAAVTLALTLIFMKPVQSSKTLRLYGWLWILFLLSTLPGRIHALTWDYAAHYTAYLFGMTCWVLAMIRAVEAEKKWSLYIWIALMSALVFSVYSALSQYVSGFDDTIKYIQDKEAKTGLAIMEGQFGNRLREARVSADFSVCNAYAGYLILLFPLLLGGLWKIGSKVSPPRAAQCLLTLPVAGLFFFLLVKTGSRGGILAMFGGLFFGVICLPFARKWKTLLILMVPVGTAALLPMIRLGRGFNSMLIRFDYYQAALKMMILHPFTGCGWGEFMSQYLLLKHTVNDESPHSPHNILLTFGSQCGFPAFLLITLLLAAGIFAACYLLYKSSRKRVQDASYTSWFCVVWSLTGWTLHAMLELNFETPGSFALAILLILLILSHDELQRFIPERITRFKGDSALWLICNALICAAALWYSPGLIQAEMNHDTLFTRSNPKYAADFMLPAPSPEEVQTMLSKCDDRSPFPYAEASDYYLLKGVYFLPNALQMLDKAIERAPNRAAFHFRKYNILRFLPGKAAEAEAALLKARELSPRNPRYYPDGITPFGKRTY